MASWTVKGAPHTGVQQDAATFILGVAKQYNASTLVMQALIFAAIMESDLGANPTQQPGSSYGGILQGNMTYFGQFGTVYDDAVWQQQTICFLQGGHGFNSAINNASSFAGQPGKLAAYAEQPDINGSLGPSGYGQYFNQQIAGRTGDAAMNFVVGEAATIVQQFGSGGLNLSTAGVTSSPKSNQTAPFYVGGPQNPSEDVWTAINRLAQARYWYLFSDGETLYLADAATIMQQPPALTLDRWDDMDKIVSLDFCWDNSAFSYQTTHTVKRRLQRKTSLAKITSPVEATLNVICDIDAVRGGDVVMLTGCGPGDGKWLVANARRSIFKVYSELTLVPAVAALTEQQAAGAGLASTSNADVPGFSAATTIGTIIQALDSAAAHINNQNLPYVTGGGRTLAGTPSNGGQGSTQGYDDVGAVAAVLANAGLWAGAVPDAPALIAKLKSEGILVSGRGGGPGNPEFSVFYGKGYFFIFINAQGAGQFWGCADGAGPAPDAPGNSKASKGLGGLHLPGRFAGTTPLSPYGPNARTGGTWLNAPSSLTGLQIYHIPTNLLGDLLNNAAGLGLAAGNYVNPFKNVSGSGLRPERVDMGVDYYAPAGSPILAIGDGTVFAVTSSGSGWTSPMNTQAFVGYTLIDGQYAGKNIYVAEDITPSVKIGDSITAGQQIATFIGSSTGLETGWASGQGYGALASSLNQQTHGGDPGAWSSAAGLSFNKFLQALGAPSGVINGNGMHGSPLPNGYPGAPWGT